MPKKQKKIETKLKKKRWFPILAPRLFAEQLIGETFLENPKDLLNRYVTVNLMSLTGDPKKQSINITFRISDVRDNRGFTECIGYEMSGSSIKRVVRRNRDRIDDSFVATTADGKVIRIKPLLLTKFNTSRSVTSTIRKVVRQQTLKVIRETTFEMLVKDIVSNRFQSKLKDNIRKIYPITSCEVRLLKVISEAGTKPITVTPPQELAEQPKEEIADSEEKEVVPSE